MNLMFLQNYALIFKSNQIPDFNDNNGLDQFKGWATVISYN